MKASLLNSTFCAGCLFAAGLIANAAPLQRADVPAEPNWVIHFDVDGLRPTAIGRFLQGEMDKPEAQAKLAAFAAIFSLDLRTGLHGLTLYGTGPNPQDGVLVVYADFDAAKLETLAKAAKDYESITYKDSTIHSWIDEKKAKLHQNARVYAAIQGARIIFGQKQASVSQALDVLTGAAARLSAGTTFAELGAAGDTSFIEGACRKMDIPTQDPNAAIVRLSKQARFQLNEAQGQVNATVTLDARDEEVAGQMLSIGQGMLNLLKLQQDKPDAVKLANALTVKQDGVQVIGTFSMSASDVLEMAKADAARKAAKRAQQKQAEQQSQ